MTPKNVPPISVLSLLLAVFMLLSACKPACDFEEPTVISGEFAALVDRSLITQEPCVPPCWYGIIPGETSDTEAAEIIEGLPFIEPASVSMQRGSQGGTITWRSIFQENQSISRGILFDRSGTVYEIEIPRLWYHITLQELIEAIGEPDGIITRPYMFSNYSDSCMAVGVVWFTKGLEVTVDLAPNSEEDDVSELVKSDDLIHRVSYFEAVTDLRDYIRIGRYQAESDNLIQWEGLK